MASRPSSSSRSSSSGKASTPAAPVYRSAGGQTFSSQAAANAANARISNLQTKQAAKAAPTTTPAATTTQKTTTNTTPKTISQQSYNAIVAQAKAAGKTDADIAASMKATGLTIAPGSGPVASKTTTTIVKPPVQNNPVQTVGTNSTVGVSTPAAAWAKLSADKQAAFYSSQTPEGKAKLDAAGLTPSPSKLGDVINHNAPGDLTDANVPANGTNNETFKAGNGKVYTVTMNPNTGKYEFQSQAPGGGLKSFNTREEAMQNIAANNYGIQTFAPGETTAGIPVSEFDKKNEAYKEEVNKMSQNVQDSLTQLNDTISSLNTQLMNNAAASAQTVAGITTQRMNGINSAYSNIDNLMNQLEVKANAVFDQGAMRKAIAKAKQMEAQGYLTAEQVAQVANYSVSDYRRDAELAKTELEKTIAEQRINIEKEQLQAIDAVQKDMTLNEQQRAQTIQGIQQRYAGVLDNINSKQNASTQLYDQLINNYNTSASAQDLGQQQLLSTDTTNYAVQQQQKQRALNDPVARRDFIINQVKDANVLKYVDTVIKKMQQSGQFMAGDVDTIMQNVLAQATILQKQNEVAGAHAGM